MNILLTALSNKERKILALFINNLLITRIICPWDSSRGDRNHWERVWVGKAGSEHHRRLGLLQPAGHLRGLHRRDPRRGDQEDQELPRLHHHGCHLHPCLRLADYRPCCHLQGFMIHNRPKVFCRESGKSNPRLQTKLIFVTIGISILFSSRHTFSPQKRRKTSSTPTKTPSMSILIIPVLSRVNFLSQIYALLGILFTGLEMALYKKDKYQR